MRSPDWESDYQLLFDELRFRHPFFDMDPRAREAQQEIANLYESLPMICKGTECRIASRCPISHRSDILETRCLLEVREITERMANYLRDLGLDNATYTDLQVVAHLVRLDVLVWRIEQVLAVEGLVVEETTEYGNRRVVKQVAHPLIAELRNLLREQRAQMDELMTSRRSRLERAEREGRMERDFMRMLQQLEERRRSGFGSATVISSEEDYAVLPASGSSSDGQPVDSQNHSEGGSQ